MTDLLPATDPWVQRAQPYRGNCHCRRCRPDVFAVIPAIKQGPQHIAVRFGHDAQYAPEHDRWRVYLDGEHIMSCYEAMAGEQGWVAVYVSDDHCGLGGAYRHYCMRCTADGYHGDDAHPCETVRYGRVEIVEDTDALRTV